MLGHPVQVTQDPDIPSASESIVDSSDLSPFVAGETHTITVDSRDRFGNPTLTYTEFTVYFLDDETVFPLTSTTGNPDNTDSTDNPDNPDNICIHSYDNPDSPEIKIILRVSELASLMNIYIHSYDNP